MWVFSIALAAVCGCRTAHSDACVVACLKNDRTAIEHLEYRLAENRAALAETRDARDQAILKEIISGIEMHLDYIRAGRSGRGGRPHR